MVYSKMKGSGVLCTCLYVLCRVLRYSLQCEQTCFFSTHMKTEPQGPKLQEWRWGTKLRSLYLFAWLRSCFKLGPLVSCVSPREQRSLTASTVEQQQRWPSLPSCLLGLPSQYNTTLFHPLPTPSGTWVHALQWRTLQTHLWVLHTSSYSPSFPFSPFPVQPPLIITNYYYDEYTISIFYNQWVI